MERHGNWSATWKSGGVFQKGRKWDMERRGALKEKEKAGFLRGGYEKWSWVGNLKREEKKLRDMGSLIRVWREKKTRGRTFGRKKNLKEERLEKKKTENGWLKEKKTEVFVEGYFYQNHYCCLMYSRPQLKMILPSFDLQKMSGHEVQTHPPMPLLVLLSNILIFS